MIGCPIFGAHFAPKVGDVNRTYASLFKRWLALPADRAGLHHVLADSPSQGCLGRLANTPADHGHHVAKPEGQSWFSNRRLSYSRLPVFWLRPKTAIHSTSMTRPQITRGWKTVALLATLLAVLILLLPHTTDHHAPALLFLLVPIFLFALLDTLAPQCLPATTSITAYHPPTRPTLFQRPPPTKS